MRAAEYRCTLGRNMADLKIRILGPVSVEVDDRPVTLGGHKQRAVLASLVARPRRPVPVDVLIDDLWGEEPPRTARNSIQRFVSDIRRALDSAGERLETINDGYRLRFDDGEVDGYRLEALIRDARQVTDPSDKYEAYQEALGLWEGRPFEGVDNPAIEAERIRLEELHASVEEGWAQSLIDLGRHTEAVPELERMVSEAPLREQRWSMLMLALYRSGRQADALRAFQKARATLVDELGIEPSAELVQLEDRILSQDPALQPTSATDDGQEVPDHARSPYKGLEAFTPSDEAVFFGREELTERILHRLSQPGLTALVGASGSGKSSVVLAGVIPAIGSDAYPGSSDWPTIVMHPGTHPIEELENAVRVSLGSGRNSSNELEPRQIERTLEEAAVNGDGLLLVVDQLEELFMLSSETEQRQFMDTLVSLTRSARVVVTLRADFYDKPLVHREFAHLLADGMETVVPLSPAELERAVTQPAAAAGVEFDPALVAEIIDDVGDQPGALPLLQYALTEVFEKRAGNMITVEDYDMVGGVAGALTARAEEAWRSFSEEQRRTARSLLLRLVAVSDTGAVARRPMPLTHLDTMDDPDVANAVVNTLVVNRLVSIDRGLQDSVPILEVAHESLLTEWTRLRTWVDQETENLRTHRRLESASAEWEAADRDPSFLLTGTRLERVDEWRAESDLALTRSEQEYVDASGQRRDEEKALEEERRERELELERRSVRRLRLLVGVMAAAIVVAGALTAFALIQQNRAEVRSAELSVRSLASTALSEFDSNPELSLLLAIEAAHISRDQLGEMTPIVEEALHRALATPQPLLTVPEGGSALDYSPDGELMAIGHADGSIDIVSTDTLETSVTIEGHDDSVETMMFSPDGSQLASASADGTTRLWDVETGLFLTSFQHDDAVTDIAWSEDGSLLLTGSVFSALVWDVVAGEVVDVVNLATSGGIPAYVGWISDRVAVGASSGLLVLWDVDTGTTLARPPLGLIDQGICALAVDPNGTMIHFGDLGGGVQSVEVESPADQEFELLPGDRSVAHDGPVCALDTGPSGLWAHAGVDGTVVVRVADGEEVRTVSHGGEVSTVAFDPEGSTIASTGTSSGGLTRVWEVEVRAVGELDAFEVGPGLFGVSVEGDLVAASGTHQALVRSLAGNDATLDTEEMQGASAVSIAAGGTIAIGASESGLVEVSHSDGSESELLDLGSLPVVLQFDEGADRLLGADTEGNVALWDLASGSLLAEHDAIIPGPFLTPLTAVDARDNSFVVVEDEPTAVVRSLEDGEEMARFPIEDTSFTSLAVGSGTLAISSRTDEISLWDTATGQQTGSLPTTDATSMAFVPDTNRLMTGGATGELIVWDAVDGTELFHLPGFPEAVLGMDVSLDGEIAVVGTSGGNVRVLALAPHLLLETAESRVDRSLTRAECRSYLALSECPDRG